MMNQKRTLWIISELFYPDETSTAYIMTEIANAMTTRYDVKIICGPEVYDKNKKRDKHSTLRLDDSMELHRVEGMQENKMSTLSRMKKFILISNRLYKQAKKNVQKGDKVLMVSNPFPLIIKMGRLRCHREFTLDMLVHDVFPEGMIKRFHIPAFIASRIVHIFNKAYASTDMLISLGRDMSDLLHRKTGGKTKIVQIENWADIDAIRPGSISNTNGITIQYSGNIGTAQNLEAFVDYLKESHNACIRFDIWGTGVMEEPLKKYVTGQGLESVVKFKGPYFRSQQNHVLNDCDVALVILRSDMYGRGVPSKTYNIMAAGKPILYIGPKGSEIGLMVEENQIGFAFTNDDKASIVSFLKDLRPEQLTGISKRARLLVEEKYSKKVILNKFVEVI